MAYEKWIRAGRRRPVYVPSETAIEVDFGRKEIELMLPHRDPFLLIDYVDRVDLKEEGLRGGRYIDPNDPIFAGHFPGFPVYPGTLMMEMIGQASICLHHLLVKGEATITSDDKPQDLRLLKLHHALFLAEVHPGDNVTFLAKMVEHDSFTVTCIGQVMKEDTICAMAIMEVYLIDEDE